MEFNTLYIRLLERLEHKTEQSYFKNNEQGKGSKGKHKEGEGGKSPKSKANPDDFGSMVNPKSLKPEEEEQKRP